MRLQDFDYELPEELIAQHPSEKRDASRLLVYHKPSKTIEHCHFYDLPKFLKAGDVLVRNNSKVIPARLKGIKEETGALVELLILKRNGNICECLCGNAKVIKEGVRIHFGELLIAECIEVKEEGIRIFKMEYQGIFLEVLEQLGSMPLPPYIHEKLEDKSRYQTTYAKVDGSAACPTAGLHFTKELDEELRKMGVHIEEVTLHVGLGTFRPVKEDDVTKHKMHHEEYSMSQKTADALNKAKAEGRRIIAVGTTSTRTLETIMQRFGKFEACEGETSIFIYPPYQFLGIDAQITNFHLPKSTLIMMIAALTSREEILEIYRQAVEEKYRFFSFGDSMFIDNE